MEQAEFKRRVAAARILSGMTQAEMNEWGRTYGIGSTILGQVERGTLKAEEEHAVAFELLFKMPGGWFREPDLDKVLFPPARTGMAPDEVRRTLERFLQGLEVAGPGEQTGSSESR